MSRWKAAAIHLTISIVLAMSIGSLLYFLWFPPPYFSAAGASKLILVLMCVDVGMGPLLTLVVVSPHKSRKLLRLDLSVIAALQSIAFAYGIQVIATARPVFVVAAVDRLMLVSAGELTDSDLAQGSQPMYRVRSWIGPVLVGALPPKDDPTLHIAMQVMSGGKDIDQLPRFYVPYDQVVDKLMHYAKPLSQLKNATERQRRQLDQLQAKTHDWMTLVALPVQRGQHDYTAIMSSKTKRPILILPIEPW